MKATAKDLRVRSKELPNTVSRGEEVIIIYRGKPCAKLVPFETSRNGEKENLLFGMWKDHPAVENVDAYVRKLRKGRF